MLKTWIEKWQQWLSPKRHSQQPATYFLHIPKTAGTSFIVWLDRFYAEDRIFPHQLWREVSHIDAHENRKYDLFRGHFGGALAGVLTHRPVQYFTILRDPKTLALSTYHYVQRETNTVYHELVNEQNLSFAEFLKHPKTTVLVKNRMIRNLSFDFEEDQAAQEVFLSAATIDHLKAIIRNPKPPISDQQRSERSRAMLNRSTWFGLVERFDESMQLLSFAMHWPPMGQSQKLNVHDSKTTFTEEESQILEQVNREDLLFYRHAQQLFEEHLATMHQSLERYRTAPQQSTDDLLDLHYQHHHSAQLAGQLDSRCCYDFAQQLYGNQWHRREVMLPENEYFRWTGPGHTASIDFWLKPVNYAVSMRIINATAEAVLDELVITINGHRVSWTTQDTGVVRIYQFECPADWVDRHGLVRLHIQCQDMISHQAAFGSDDERLVGVAVHWIKFNHVS